MAKHSRAKKVKMGFRKRQGSLEFYYEDDGVGFNYDEIIRRPQRRKADVSGLGLLGLKERVELLEGSIHIDTAPARGMRVVVTIGA